MQNELGFCTNVSGLRAEEDDVDGNNIPPASEAFLPEEEIELSGLFYLQQQGGFFSDFDEVKGDI